MEDGPRDSGDRRSRSRRSVVRVGELESVEEERTFGELVRQADAVLKAYGDGRLGLCTEVVLARLVRANDAARRKGKVDVPVSLPRCMWCATSGLTHDPKCPSYFPLGSFDD